ncbi:MAG: hypothetical protein ACXWLH_05895 [Candidatus Saccharimonadales bacterium]
MGSSVTRKSNDRPVINRPKSSNGGGGTGGGFDSQPVDINNVCPLAFDAKLSDQTVPVGTKLVLDERVLRTGTGAVVGQLTALQQRMVQQCAGMGYAYNEVDVVDKKGTRYAEIKR